MTDLSSLSFSSSEMPLHLRHPLNGEELYDDDGKPIRIWLVGSDSAEFRKIKADMFAKNRKAKNVTFDRAERMAAEILARATTKFENFLYEGEPLKYTKEAAIDLYRDPAYAWLKEQVDDFIVDRSNFLADSGKS